MAKQPDKVTADNAFDSLYPRAPRVPEGDKQLTVIIPERIVDQLKAQATSERETLRTVVLKALKTAGYDVSDDDLVDRRRPAGRARSEAYFQEKMRRAREAK